MWVFWDPLGCTEEQIRGFISYKLMNLVLDFQLNQSLCRSTSGKGKVRRWAWITSSYRPWHSSNWCPDFIPTWDLGWLFWNLCKCKGAAMCAELGGTGMFIYESDFSWLLQEPLSAHLLLPWQVSNTSARITKSLCCQVLIEMGLLLFYFVPLLIFVFLFGLFCSPSLF